MMNRSFKGSSGGWGCSFASLLNLFLLVACTSMAMLLLSRSGRQQLPIHVVPTVSPPGTTSPPNNAVSLAAPPPLRPRPTAATTSAALLAVSSPPVTPLDAALGAGAHRLDMLHWVAHASKDAQARGVLPGGKQCDALFGERFLDLWRGREHLLCRPDPAASDPVLAASQVRGYVNTHNGKHWMVAEAFNVVLDAKAYSSKKGRVGPEPAAGSLRAACLQGEHDSALDVYPVAQEVRAALLAGQRDSVLRACGPSSRHVVEHPVLLLYRYDTTNAFHNLEDVMTVFAALALLNASTVMGMGVEVFIADDHSLGYYPEIWQRLSHPFKLRMLHDEPLPSETCFRHVIRTPFAGASLLSYTGVGQRSNCNSPLVTGLSHWLRAALFPEITSQRRTFDVALQTQIGDRRIITRTVVWITRRNYEGLASRTWNTWQRDRMFGNEHQLLLDLHTAILQWNDRACFRQGRVPVRLRSLMSTEEGDGVSSVQQPRRQLRDACRDRHVVYELQVVELSDVAFYPDQVSQLTRMSILVAAHGAGLANQIWMRPGAGAVIELGHNSGGNFHYGNMASWLGHKYSLVRSSGRQLDVAKAVAALHAMMDALA